NIAQVTLGLPVDNTQFAYTNNAFRVGSAVGDDVVTQSLINAIQNSDKDGVSACLPPYSSFIRGQGDWYGKAGLPGVGTDWTQYLDLATGDAWTMYSWIKALFDTSANVGTNSIPWALYSCPPLFILPFPVTPVLTHIQ